MTLLDSLLDAILRLDGEALVMHAGEKPYIVLSSTAVNTFRGPLAWGQVELSSRPLTAATVLGMLAQMLSPSQSHTLDEFGAIEQEFDAPGDSGERFVVTAARGGDDVWVEVRRRAKVVEAPAPAPQQVPHEQPDAAAPAASLADATSVPVLPAQAQLVAEPPEPAVSAQDDAVPAPQAQTDAEHVVPLLAGDPAQEVEATGHDVHEIHEIEDDLSAIVDGEGGSAPVFEVASMPDFTLQTEASRFDDEDEQAAVVVEIDADGAFELEAHPPVVGVDGVPDESIVLQSEELTADETLEETISLEELVAERPREAARDALAQPSTPEPVGEPQSEPEPEPFSVVVPHARPALKLHQPPPPPAPAAASKEAPLVELLRAAVSHRASTVYAVVDTRPMMRVEGQISLVGTHPSVAAGDVERFIFEFAPRDQVVDTAPEWTCTVPGVGRTRCVTFHDYSGAGLIFHLPAGESSSADELAIPAEVQALCGEADGLVVVAGPRSSGKSTLLSAFVDLINRTRYDHVITIESQIRRVHEKRLSFISQREVRGDGEAIAAAARRALREGPDVLVIEDLRAPEALVAALDAARAGRLVFGSISARTAPAALERLIDAFPADRRSQVRASLAGSLRAVIAQLLVAKAAGGRIAAREVLFSSPAVRQLILNGAIEQLAIAIESGRSQGMKTMVDSLGALVRDAVVEIGDACGCAPDRAALISALERDGIDVTGVERRA